MHTFVIFRRRQTLQTWVFLYFSPEQHGFSSSMLQLVVPSALELPAETHGLVSERRRISQREGGGPFLIAGITEVPGGFVQRKKAALEAAVREQRRQQETDEVEQSSVGVVMTEVTDEEDRALRNSPWKKPKSSEISANGDSEETVELEASREHRRGGENYGRRTRRGRTTDVLFDSPHPSVLLDLSKTASTQLGVEAGIAGFLQTGTGAGVNPAAACGAPEDLAIPVRTWAAYNGSAPADQSPVVELQNFAECLGPTAHTERPETSRSTAIKQGGEPIEMNQIRVKLLTPACPFRNQFTDGDCNMPGPVLVGRGEKLAGME